MPSNSTDKIGINSAYAAAVPITMMLFNVVIVLAWFIMIKLQRRKLNRICEQIEIKEFGTSNADEQQLKYHCNILRILLCLTDNYKSNYYNLYNGKSIAYTATLKERFTRLFDFVIKIADLEHKKYKGVYIPFKEQKKMRQTLRKSFVVCHKDYQSGGLIDNFADFSELFLTYMIDIYNKYKARSTKECEEARDGMLNEIKIFYEVIENALDRQKIIFTECTCENEPKIIERRIPYDFKNLRLHSIEFFECFVDFVEGYFEHMKTFEKISSNVNA